MRATAPVEASSDDVCSALASLPMSVFASWQSPHILTPSVVNRVLEMELSGANRRDGRKGL